MSDLPPLRRQQAEALAAISAAWRGGRQAAWVVLPPGGGKTRVGLEALALHEDPAVVLVPNTAVQSQWIAQAGMQGRQAGDGRELTTDVTVLTYQSVALFQTRDDDSDDADNTQNTGDDPTGHLDRLHPNAVALIDRLASLGPFTLVLDECHHLLAVWGELLAEVLDRLPEARILALTATPPESLSADESILVERLFGHIVYSASIPGFVRDGHLAPFRELVWFTDPTDGEADYLRETSLRFAQIRSDLMTPGLTSVGLLEWFDQRFVRRAATTGSTTDGAVAISWQALTKDQPGLADAVLRAHSAGLLALPDGARLREQHRAPLDGDDWSLLLDDFIRGVLLDSADPRDAATLERVREAVPGIGLRLTRRGLVRTTSPVDRVVARSAAKGSVAVDIADLESTHRGDDLRVLILCDFERASPQVPEGLVGVIEPQEGSAIGVLRRLVAVPSTDALAPVMVSGRTVACGASSADRLLAWLKAQDQTLDVRAVSDDGITRIEGAWDSRRWVPLMTRWFEAGEGGILIGTRALLGEGWDARRVNVLIDLTTATTAMSVTQTRGRALRTDPADPLKVSHTWTVVCIADGHPLGDRDYQRFVRKHAGFFAVTDDGLITDGVAHVHPALSEFTPPNHEQRDIIRKGCVTTANDRDRTRALWRIGEPYEDEPVADIRIRADRGMGLSLGSLRPIGEGAVVGSTGRVRLRPRWSRALGQWVTGNAEMDETAELARAFEAFASAVADAMAAIGLHTRGHEDVRYAPTSDGAYRFWLADVGEDVSATFTESLDEVLSPLTSPRYLVPRYVIPVPNDKREARRLAWRQLWRLPIGANVVWHAVPSALAGRRESADAFASAWNLWVSPGRAMFAGSPEGVGVLTSQRGDDPFEVTTMMRVEWR